MRGIVTLSSEICDRGAHGPTSRVARVSLGTGHLQILKLWDLGNHPPHITQERLISSLARAHKRLIECAEGWTKRRIKLDQIKPTMTPRRRGRPSKGAQVADTAQRKLFVLAKHHTSPTEARVALLDAYNNTVLLTHQPVELSETPKNTFKESQLVREYQLVRYSQAYRDFVEEMDLWLQNGDLCHKVIIRPSIRAQKLLPVPVSVDEAMKGNQAAAPGTWDPGSLLEIAKGLARWGTHGPVIRSVMVNHKTDALYFVETEDIEKGKRRFHCKYILPQYSQTLRVKELAVQWIDTGGLWALAEVQEKFRQYEEESIEDISPTVVYNYRSIPKGAFFDQCRDVCSSHKHQAKDGSGAICRRRVFYDRVNEVYHFILEIKPEGEKSKIGYFITYMHNEELDPNPKKTFYKWSRHNVVMSKSPNPFRRNLFAVKPREKVEKDG